MKCCDIVHCMCGQPPASKDNSSPQPTAVGQPQGDGTGDDSAMDTQENQPVVCSPALLLSSTLSCSCFLILIGATRGVMVSMSAYLACHQCYCAGWSLAWGLNLRAGVCGIF